MENTRPKQTKEKIQSILNRITFKFFEHDFEFRVFSKGDGFLIQVRTVMRDCITNKMGYQHGGKHYISQHAIDSEVVFKGLKACKDFVDHELHEAFRVDDVQLFDPHLDIDSLLDSIRYMKRDSRAGSWTPQKTMENV